MRKIIIGIDPGKNGALVALNADGVFVAKDVMPISAKEVDCDSLQRFLTQFTDEVHVFLEKVHAMPKQGVNSVFTFGMGYGMIRGILGARYIPYTLVPPQKWQKNMHGGCDMYLDAKKRSLQAANRLFPTVELLATERSRKPHDGIVDALLIAEYGRRTFNG